MQGGRQDRAHNPRVAVSSFFISLKYSGVSIVSCARRIYRPQYTLAAARSLFHHAAGEYPEQHRISIHDGLGTFLVACEKARFLVAFLCLREHRRLHRRRAFAAVTSSL
jgi:hypothetical protein